MSEELNLESVDQEMMGGDKLDLLASLAKAYKKLEDEINFAEEELKLKKKDLESISREKIPSILNSTGMSEIRLSSGEKIKITDKVHASITDKNYTLAYRNMVNAEGGDEHAEGLIDSLFKAQLVIEDMSEKTRTILIDNDIAYEEKRSIHTQTLGKYCRERLESGKDIPEGISVFQYQETKITN
jgi:hypothetical protein